MVYRWRREVLLKAEFTVPQAERLAAGHCDLHDAQRLRSEGCPPDIAFDILDDGVEGDSDWIKVAD